MKPIFTSDSIMEKLVCEICKNYLSIFPIHTKDDGTVGICGRCVVADSCYKRDTPYEFIAQYLEFPCCNTKNGCKEISTPADLEDHEKVCAFKRIECPTKKLSKCLWKGQQFELTDHYKEKHSRLLMKNDGISKLEFTKNFTEAALLPFGGELFMVKRELNTETNLFTCCVTHLRCYHVTRYYKYFLTLSTIDGIFSYRFPTHTIGDTVTIDSALVNEKLHNNSVIRVQIELIELDADEHSKTLAIKDNDKINWELLNELKCGDCKTFMLPPIYSCRGFHNFGGECKPSQCTVCQLSLSENISLTRIAEVITYPCKYYTDGCNHSGNHSEIEIHQRSCEYGSYKCPLSESTSCPWSSHFSLIYVHITFDHVDSILTNGMVHVPLNDISVDFNEKFYVILLAKRAFKVHYKFENKKMYWAVQLVGPSAECKKYRVEIDIVDSSENDLKRCARGLCSPATASEYSFHDNRYYLAISLDDIEPLIAKFFNYRISVLPVEDYI